MVECDDAPDSMETCPFGLGDGVCVSLFHDFSYGIPPATYNFTSQFINVTTLYECLAEIN